MQEKSSINDITTEALNLHFEYQKVVKELEFLKEEIRLFAQGHKKSLLIRNIGKVLISEPIPYTSKKTFELQIDEFEKLDLPLKYNLIENGVVKPKLKNEGRKAIVRFFHFK